MWYMVTGTGRHSLQSLVFESGEQWLNLNGSMVTLSCPVKHAHGGFHSNSHDVHTTIVLVLYSISSYCLCDHTTRNHLPRPQ